LGVKLVFVVVSLIIELVGVTTQTIIALKSMGVLASSSSEY